MTAGRRKQMVEVTALHLVDGTVAPLKVSLKDGRSFEVETFHDPASTTSQPTLHRYPVQIRGRSTYLYEENGRWWVLMKS